MTLVRLFAAAVAVSLTSSCAILAPIFGFDRASEPVSVYQSAMADFSQCETASDAAERAAAADRLARAAATMLAETQPTDPDHFYQLDRVTAADSRCREVLQTR